MQHSNKRKGCSAGLADSTAHMQFAPTGCGRMMVQAPFAKACALRHHTHTGRVQQSAGATFTGHIIKGSRTQCFLPVQMHLVVLNPQRMAQRLCQQQGLPLLDTTTLNKPRRLRQVSSRACSSSLPAGRRASLWTGWQSQGLGANEMSALPRAAANPCPRRPRLLQRGPSSAASPRSLLAAAQLARWLAPPAAP